jgi:hypothetical protein
LNSPHTPFHILSKQPQKMSTTDANLVIEHSSAECEPDYVQSKFDQIFGNGFVVDVIEEVITAGDKKFYLIVDQDHPALMRLTDLIHENTFAAVVYKKEWNKTTRKYTEVYWKVVAHYPQFIPYLANEEQFAEMFAPKPSFIRCDSVEMPGPCMLERSTNEPRIESVPRPDEYYDAPTQMERSESDAAPLVRSMTYEEYLAVKTQRETPMPMERSESDTAPSQFETPKPMERSESDAPPPPPTLFRAMTVEVTEEDRASWASYKSTEGDSLVPKSLFRSFDETWRP